jgi:hypothetical protein
MSKAITLGCGRQIGLGRYVAAWKACLTLPPHTHIGRGVDGWGQNAGEALRDLRKGLDDRINRHLPWYGKGRKWDGDWQRSMARAARDLNGPPRLILRWLPADLMKVDRFRERVEADRAA